MLHKAICFFSVFFPLIGILVSEAQNTDSVVNNLPSDGRENIFYYYHAKDVYALRDIYRADYDVFGVHYYNKAQIPDGHYYLQLNNEGSPVRDMIFFVEDIFEYKRRQNVYQPYVFDNGNVKYFQNSKAYTSVSYSNSISGNQFFDVNFAKNLYKGLNLQTDFFVNYADGEFASSQVMNQFFNVTLNYISPKGRYRNGLAFIHNRAYIQENGGIENDSVFINHQYSKPGSYPVALKGGWSKWKTSDYSFFQTYRLETDTSVSCKIFNKGAVMHSLSYGRYASLYDDSDKIIKDSLGTDIWRNSVFWTNDIYGKRKNFFIPLTIGVNYDVLNFNDSLNSETYHLVSPEFKTAVSYKRFVFDVHSAFILTSEDYKNDYHIKVSAHYGLDRESENVVFAQWIIQDKQPDYIFKHYLTENLSWDNEVEKTHSQVLSLGVNLQKRFVIQANYTDLKDYYFLDNAFNVKNGDSKVYQLQVKNDFQFGSWRFMGVWTLQKAEKEDVLHIPLIAIKQGFAYSFTWMKGKLKTDAGCDINYFSKYKADIYSPYTGMYCYQDIEKIGNYLFADFYLNVNIKRFCFFVMLQHPYAGLFDYNYFNSPLYPSQGFTFRYGFVWNLFN